MSALEQAAAKLYDQNLSILVDKLKHTGENRRSLWRVVLDENGIIVSCKKSAKIGKPEASSFLFIIPGNCKEPSFGNFGSLSGHQVGIAESMKLDLSKLVKTTELAYCLQQVSSSPDIFQSGLAKLSKRFGNLPAASQRNIDKKEKKESREVRVKLERRKRILKAIPCDVFDQCLQNYKSKVTPYEIAKDKYRYFSFHYTLHRKRYQFIQVYTEPL